MKIDRFSAAVTAVNLGMMLFACWRDIRPAIAQDAAATLRGRALEIVDPEGRVRASIRIEPPVTADGTTYPETAILRLVDPAGRPAVKLAASVRGAGISLMGEGQGTYVVLKGDGKDTSLRLTNVDGRERVIAP